jgi:hypothetical protein
VLRVVQTTTLEIQLWHWSAGPQKRDENAKLCFEFAFTHARFSHTSFKTSMCTVSDSCKHVFEADLLKRRHDPRGCLRAADEPTGPAHEPSDQRVAPKSLRLSPDVRPLSPVSGLTWKPGNRISPGSGNRIRRAENAEDVARAAAPRARDVRLCDTRGMPGRSAKARIAPTLLRSVACAKVLPRGRTGARTFDRRRRGVNSRPKLTMLRWKSSEVKVVKRPRFWACFDHGVLSVKPVCTLYHSRHDGTRPILGYSEGT